MSAYRYSVRILTILIRILKKCTYLIIPSKVEKPQYKLSIRVVPNKERPYGGVVLVPPLENVSPWVTQV